MKKTFFAIIIGLTMLACVNNNTSDYTVKIDDQVRAEQIKGMKFGMFICWSFSTFNKGAFTENVEWTIEPHGPDFFNATECDTDQWCEVAKDAGMEYILFLTKHSDGFCLWDTKTTDLKVTNSPLKIDVLAKLRKSCDKYGIKLALYINEGDWTWPGRWTWEEKKGSWQGIELSRSGKNAEAKKAQLKELLTNYGPIEFFWLDHAIGDGGLSHEKTVEWINQFQPNCFVGFNSGESAGRLLLRERGTPGPIGYSAGERYRVNTHHSQYLAAEFTYPILPEHKGGADWFYSLPVNDSLCHSAEKIYQDYLGAVTHGNIFSLDLGPDYQGRLREIDVKTLQQVGRYIRGEDKLPETGLSGIN